MKNQKVHSFSIYPIKLGELQGLVTVLLSLFCWVKFYMNMGIFLKIDLSIASQVGLVEACLYALYLLRADEKKQCVLTHAQASHMLSIKEYTVKTAKDRLIAAGKITTAMGGIPCKEVIILK